MLGNQDRPRIPLPRGWPDHVKSAVLHIISLAHYSIAYTRGWAADSLNARVRLAAERGRLEERVALLEEELRIKDARMVRIPAQRRPYYLPTERMAVLELRAARGWSLSQTAGAVLVTAATIASWVKRIEKGGPNALVETRAPVNRFPDLVRYLVQRLKTLCPAMGKRKIAETLCRAGLHLGTTTVGRILKEHPKLKPATDAKPEASNRIITAKRVNHIWHVDLTVVPIAGGLWASWLPFALPQCWPFCWWVAVAIDHFSRRAMGFAVFEDEPNSQSVRSFLGRTVKHSKATPKYVICDKGKQFWCLGFKDWCRRKGIRPRFGAVGQHGSIAVVERFIQTMKNEATRRILVPLRRESLRRELSLFFAWHNEHRPHTTWGGRTPDEVYLRLRPANRRPRVEPRNRWPRSSPCAGPHTLIAGRSGDRFTLEIAFHGGRRHLPVVTLRRAA